MTHGHLIRRYREKNSLSPREFSEKLGVAESTLRSIENGTRVITPATALRCEEVTAGQVTRVMLLPELYAPRVGAKARAA